MDVRGLVKHEMPGATYTAPPIVEAVIQIGYVDPLSDASYRKVVKRLKRGYANSQSTQLVNANIDFVTRAVHWDEQPQQRLSSADEADALIVNRNLLTWSRLAPYQGWNVLMERIKADAIAAHDLLGYRKLSRLGMRYVNRLDIPQTPNGTAEFEDYLAINIDMPSAIPSVLNYVWRFEHELLDQQLLVVVQSAMGVAEVPRTSAFILDIDIIASVDLPARLDDLFVKLEEMRNAKNRFFELSIRDKARAIFSA